MNSRYDRDSDLDDFRDEVPREREISLGTATILGIFFGLALVCALFFGFGYTLGRRSAPPPQGAVVSEVPPVPGDGGGGAAKPSPGSPTEQSVGSQSKGGRAAGESSQATPEQVVVRDAGPAQAGRTQSQPEVRQGAAAAAAAPVVAPPPAAMVAPGTPGSAVVQVAAVSHQEDADLLLAALKRKGYTVAVRQVPQDKLLHVQIGPFASKKDAVAMQQRLQADGYNAIVK